MSKSSFLSFDNSALPSPDPVKLHYLRKRVQRPGSVGLPGLVCFGSSYLLLLEGHRPRAGFMRFLLHGRSVNWAGKAPASFIADGRPGGSAVFRVSLTWQCDQGLCECKAANATKRKAPSMMEHSLTGHMSVIPSLPNTLAVDRLHRCYQLISTLLWRRVLCSRFA